MARRRALRLAVLTGVAGWWWLAMPPPVAHLDLPPPPPPTSTTTAPPPVTVPTTVEASCHPPPLAARPLIADDPSTLSQLIAVAAFSCPPAVVVATSDAAIPVAVELASTLQSPLLLGEDLAMVEATAAHLGVQRIYLLGEARWSSWLKIVPLTEVEARRIAAAPDEESVGPVPRDTVWLALDGDPRWAAPVQAAAAARGEEVVLVERGDLPGSPRTVAVVRRLNPTLVVAAGPFDPEALEWQLPALVAAAELPGGGLTLFPHRRLVAFYGNPLSPNLGVLGRQGPEETLERLQPEAAAYAAEGLLTVPAFEIIATVASTGPGADGNYSEEMEPETLRPWIELAGDRGVYVVLDLQSGRTDFLTQARRYEEFLRLPHVGLALDPEWRLGPDQVHLRQVGTVDAAEINTVVEWLRDLVRRENLPQKLLLLHQFKLSMITNRESIDTPAELAVVIQMDGQGPLGSKFGTYSIITADAADVSWRWGWKNFYDLDTPLATPEEVLGLDPVPIFISFQ